MYAKLFTSLYQGTLRGNSHCLLVFTNLLAHCDKTGSCDIHPRAIAEEVGLTIDQVRAALDVLEAPDEESRSPEESGRRIIRLDEHRAWGWRVVNYLKYRAIRDEDDRREQNRISQERWRNKNKPPSAGVITSKPSKPESAHTEAEGEKDLSQPSVAHPPAQAGGKKTHAIACPYDAIVSRYSAALPTLPGVSMRDGPTWTKRQKAMRDFWAWLLASKRPDGSRRAESANEALVWIETYFARAGDNDFVMGRTQPGRGHEGWKADLDYLLSAKGMKQVLERTQEAS